MVEGALTATTPERRVAITPPPVLLMVRQAVTSILRQLVPSASPRPSASPEIDETAATGQTSPPSPGDTTPETLPECLETLIEASYYTAQLRAHRVQPGRTATARHLDLPSEIEHVLAARGIERLYAHQAAAIAAARAGDHVVTATPTASGKSLTYTLPALEHALDHDARTLYLAPQRALITDQEHTFREYVTDLDPRLTVGQYTGRLSRTEKRQVRKQEPHILLVTPDMLNYSLLPYAEALWAWLFESLEYVVLDELHQYRGVFGSHVALVLRRLRRLAARYDSSPQFLCTSATIGNPLDHAASLTGHPRDQFSLIDTDASDTGPTHWAFWEPQGDTSPHRESMRVFTDLIRQGLQTVVFTRSRQTAERYATQSAQRLRSKDEPDLADRVAAYQAALPSEQRRDLEAGLQNGTIRGVWSTNALELGIDIGSLDAIVLDGYPGTRMETFQQAGRAGRGTDASLVVLVGGDDPLDQYVLGHPDGLLQAEPEVALVNPSNETVLAQHLPAAAAEYRLTPDDATWFPAAVTGYISSLTDAGALTRHVTDAGLAWTPPTESTPAYDLSLRSIDDRSITLRETGSGDTLGTLSFGDALRDVYPGAIYHHQGTTYEVRELNLDTDVAILAPTNASYTTAPVTDTTLEITARHDTAPLAPETSSVPDQAPHVTTQFASVAVCEQVVGYRHFHAGTPTSDPVRLDLPATTLETNALVIPIPDEIAQRVHAECSATGFRDGLRGLAHALVRLTPLELLCARHDIRSLAALHHMQTDCPTIFLYDAHPGGVGLARGGYARAYTLVEAACDRIGDCGCEDGCPACIQLPQSQDANDTLDKQTARTLATALLAA